MDSSVCVFNTCLSADELLCFYGISDVVLSGLIACIKIAVYLTNPKQLATIPLFGHTEILHMLVSMGNTALVAAVALSRCVGLNFARGISEVLKRGGIVTLHNSVQCVRLV